MAQKLSRLDWVVVGAGAIALISLFLPWEGASWSYLGVTDSASVSGFSTGYGWLGGLLIVAAAAFLVLVRLQVNLPKLPAGPAVIVLGASLLGAVLVILRWLTLPKGGGVSGIASYSYGPRAGLIITLLMGIVEAVCTFRLFRASGEALPWNTASASPGSHLGTPVGGTGGATATPPGPVAPPGGGYIPQAGTMDAGPGAHAAEPETGDPRASGAEPESPPTI